MANEERPLLFKITFTCFLLFIFFTGISITISQGLLILTAILWLYGCLKKTDCFQYRRTGLERYIAVFIAVSVILALFSPSRIANLLYLRDFWLLAAFVLASSLIRTGEDLKRVVYVFIIVAVFQSVAAYAQYILDINYLNAYKYGIGHWKARLPLGEIAVGFLGHHLTFGGYIMMIAVPLFYLSFLKKKDSPGARLPAMIRISSVMLVVTIILAWARSVIVALPFAAAPLVTKSKRLFIAVACVVMTLIFPVFSELGPSEDFSGNLYNESSMIRIQIWRHAFNLFKEHPFIGTGGGNYSRMYREEVEETRGLDERYFKELKEYHKAKKRLWRARKRFNSAAAEYKKGESGEQKGSASFQGVEKKYKNEIKRFEKAKAQFEKEEDAFVEVQNKYHRGEVLFQQHFPSMVTHAHNDYLNQLVRKGLIGFFAFMYMLYGIVKYMFENLKNNRNRFHRYFYLGLFGSVTAFLIASMFQCYYTDEENLVMFWLNIGILAAIVGTADRDSAG